MSLLENLFVKLLIWIFLMVCQDCLEKREKTLKSGFNHNRRNLNDNFLSLNAARKVGVNMHLEHKKFA